MIFVIVLLYKRFKNNASQYDLDCVGEDNLKLLFWSNRFSNTLPFHLSSTFFKILYFEITELLLLFEKMSHVSP